MAHELSHIANLLNDRLLEYSRKNPAFSLRALSRRLQMSPSHLSRILRGERQLSDQTTLRIARELNLNTQEITLLLSSSKEKRVRGRKAAQSTTRLEKRILEAEVFEAISNWYYFPLLELIETKGFQSDERWISKKLGLTQIEVRSALNRLENLKLITRIEGKIVLTGNEFYQTSDDIQNQAIRKHHGQMLEKSAEALVEDPVDREFQALNLKFHPSQLKEAKKIIREFTRNFNRRFADPDSNEIFQMNIQFFKLTKETK